MSEIGVGVAIGSSTPPRSSLRGLGLPGARLRGPHRRSGDGAGPARGRRREILARGLYPDARLLRKARRLGGRDRRRGVDAHRRHGPARADGHLRFMGRYKDMLKIGGENVDPMEVEAYLMAHPAVNLVAVVGVPRRAAERGRRGVRARGAGPAGHRGRGARPLPGPYRELQDPRRVLFVDEFPMTSSGKIQKVKLRAEALRLAAGGR